MAVALAERPLGLEQIGIDQSLDHDLGVGRHHEIDGHRPGDRDRHAGKPAGHRHLVEIDRQLHAAGEHHDRRAADHDRARHRRAALLVLLPMQVAAGAADARRHAHAEPVRRLQLRPVGAHVGDAGVGIAGDAERRRQIRRGIEARRRDRHRQRREPPARPAQIVAGEHHLLAGGRGHDDRRDRMRDAGDPGGFDLLDLPAHAGGVNAPATPRAHRPRPGCRSGGRRRRSRDRTGTRGAGPRRVRPGTASAPAGATRCPCRSAGRCARSRPCASRAARCCWKSSGGPPPVEVGWPACVFTSSIRTLSRHSGAGRRPEPESIARL